MSYMFGVTYSKPSRKKAKMMDKICIEEEGWGYVEVNVDFNDCPSINNGNYQGWFEGPNMGCPFDRDLKNSVMNRIKDL